MAHIKFKALCVFISIFLKGEFTWVMTWDPPQPTSPFALIDIIIAESFQSILTIFSLFGRSSDPIYQSTREAHILSFTFHGQWPH